MMHTHTFFTYRHGNTHTTAGAKIGERPDVERARENRDGKNGCKGMGFVK